MNWGIWLLLMTISSSAFAIRYGVSGSNIYVAELEINRSRGMEHICTGVRIHRDYVLTATHCFDDFSLSKNFKVKYRDGNRTRTNTVRHNQVIKLSSIYEKELALVPIQPQSNFFTPPTIFRGDYSERTLRFYGYGMNQNGKFGTLRTATLNYSHIYTSSKGTMLVTSPGAGNANPCPGDSGGPLFAQGSNKQELIGIVSFIRKASGSINTNDRLKACKRANQAFFIPLTEHIEFLETYFPVLLAPLPEVATNLAVNETSPEEEEVLTEE